MTVLDGNKLMIILYSWNLIMIQRKRLQKAKQHNGEEKKIWRGT